MIFNIAIMMALLIGWMISGKMLAIARLESGIYRLKGITAIRKHPFSYLYLLLCTILMCLILLQTFDAVNLNLGVEIEKWPQMWILIFSMGITLNLLLTNNYIKDYKDAKKLERELVQKHAPSKLN